LPSNNFKHWTVASALRYVRLSETFIEDVYQRAISATLGELTGQE
jgi:integrase/recombinase XerD